MKVLTKLDNDGGLSRDQGGFWNPRDVIKSIPRPGSITKIPSIFAAKLPILSTLKAVLAGNQRLDVGRGGFRVFPTNASEANHPQKVTR